ncbi:hypothetical protein VKT23_014832 [Stygiomarasmius scandens]|uniref:P-loop containing nucleoside triphosphate hydrolase protein n=1 Tax=Marasmiellus scandens TaxID=2682957 RepID=A0ABR1J0P0_9AGAR
MSGTLEDNGQQERVLLICVGLIGSGKSTFAISLEKHFPNFVRCNQDELGDRRSVENRARASLNEGRSVCIDRTNFNPAQRRYWIDIAHEFPGTLIWVIVFDTPYEECTQRLQLRTSHPTIKNPEQAMSVLARFASDFQAPVAVEGFDRMIYLRSSEQAHPEYSQSQVTTVLQSIRDSPSLSHTRSHFHGTSRPSRSRPRGYNRGRGHGRGYFNFDYNQENESHVRRHKPIRGSPLFRVGGQSSPT